MHDLKIHMIITSRYLAFDSSGKLPFSLAIGLVRRSPEDDDPRPLLWNTENSILNLPYAFSNKLLTLRVYNPENGRDTEVDVGQLSQPDNKEDSFVTLPSPVGRTESWKNCLSIYQCHIDPSSELASKLEPGKKYIIKSRAPKDLGGTCMYIDQAESPREQEKSSKSSQNPKLVSSAANGRAIFTVLPSLPWPPKIQTQMQRYRSDDGKGDMPQLEIKVVNTGSEAVTVQTSGQQRFLYPKGPLEDEDGGSSADSRARIIDSKLSAVLSTIQVIDMATDTVVREASKPDVCGGGGVNPDPCPRLQTLVTLKPGEPLVRHVEIGKRLSGLPDGTYGLRMEPRGMWWCAGGCEEFAAEDEERVPQHLFKSMIPPLMLECDDIVEVRVENGEVVK